MSTDTQGLQRLAEFGQSVWIDYLSRELLESGELARLVREDAVVGVTSNPTIFEQAISHGEAYDAQLRELLSRGLRGKDLFLELACADVAAGCDLLRPVWEQSGGRDGYVFDRGRSHSRLRHGRPIRGGPSAARADRAAESARQD